MGPSTIALVVITLAWAALSNIYATLGHAGAPLDDTYIHFQYARAIAEGHPMRFQPGEPITSGSTSLLWPAILAPFYALGFRGSAVLWPAWMFTFGALGLLAYEAFRLAQPLAGKPAAIIAAALILSCSGLTWCAASAMEVVPFAWVLARTFRRAIEWAERHRGVPSENLVLRPRYKEVSSPSRKELIALAWTAVLLRPEGLLASGFVVLTLICRRPKENWTRRDAWTLVACALALPAIPCLLWALTGEPRSLTAIVKLLPGNPYYPPPHLFRTIVANTRLLVGTLLNGEAWSAEFLPSGGGPIALAGLVATGILGRKYNRNWRAAGIVILAAGIFIPCCYATFLWNRLRYLWPFASGWLVGLACLTGVAGNLINVRPAYGRWLTWGLGAFLIALFVSHQKDTLDDIATSASAIDRQQVTLGRWAAEHLPPDARIGLNDTGAISYFSGRKTFDVVGLTTAEEGKYWVAGPASRFEHYERLWWHTRDRLPTHFFVYPEWMACNILLGVPLVEATVTDSTILGGATMRGFIADYHLLGSGENPWTRFDNARDLLDSVDIADLESEKEHHYDLLDARDGQQEILVGIAPDGQIFADGGRSERTADQFVARLRTGEGSIGTVRYRTRVPMPISVEVAGQAIAFWDSSTEAWEEHSFAIPPALSRPQTHITLIGNGKGLTTFHYWFTDIAP